MYLLNTLYGTFGETEKKTDEDIKLCPFYILRMARVERRKNRQTKRHKTMYLLNTSYGTDGETEDQTDG